MKNSRDHLQLVVDNPTPIKMKCAHRSISAFSENIIGSAHCYICDYCKTKFSIEEIGIFQDALGYAGYYAITD